MPTLMLCQAGKSLRLGIAFHMKMMQMYCGVSADELRHADGAEIVVASLHVPFHARGHGVPAGRLPRRFPGRFGE